MTERQVEFTELSTAQRQALRHVEERTRLRQAEAGDRLTTILRDAQCLDGMFEEGMQSIRTHARVALHFHPDRFGLKPMTVAESLLEDGHYRNQFETGLSSGSRTAFPGGERDRWEKDLFGGAYHGADVTADERPKYGALALIHHPDGPTPRFGSCYFVLRASVSRRTSFTFSGSEYDLAPERLGTIDRMDCVMAALLTEVASGQARQYLGRRSWRPHWVSKISRFLTFWSIFAGNFPPRRLTLPLARQDECLTLASKHKSMGESTCNAMSNV